MQGVRVFHPLMFHIGGAASFARMANQATCRNRRKGIQFMARNLANVTYRLGFICSHCSNSYWSKATPKRYGRKSCSAKVTVSFFFCNGRELSPGYFKERNLALLRLVYGLNPPYCICPVRLRSRYSGRSILITAYDSLLASLPTCKSSHHPPLYRASCRIEAFRACLSHARAQPGCVPSMAATKLHRVPRMRDWSWKGPVARVLQEQASIYKKGDKLSVTVCS